MASVKGMLEMGKECGLKWLAGAYSNYMNHYDCFFTIANIEEEEKVFHDEMLSLGLLRRNEDGKLCVNEMTIDHCLEIMQ